MMTMELLPFGELDRHHSVDRLFDDILRKIKQGGQSDLSSEEQIYVLLYYFLAVVRRKNGLHRRYQYRKSLLAELSALAWVGDGNSLDPIYDKLREVMVAIDQDPKVAKGIVASMFDEREKQFSDIQRTRRKGNQLESALDSEVRSVLKRNTGQSWREVLDRLERRVGAGVITEISATRITYRVRPDSDDEASLSTSSLPNKVGAIRKSISMGR